ncbi:MAG: hypothetical protein F6K56_15630 [Moorea sp. SIO3G5]|nr:hypothetical protein [Moorena sp. SIO3G5]
MSISKSSQVEMQKQPATEINTDEINLSLGAFIRYIREADIFDLSAIMTLLLLLTYPTDFWYVVVPVRILCILGLVYPAWQRNYRFWLLITSIVLAGDLYNWFTIDNHKYLLAYWCLAMCFSARSSNVKETLAVNARLLIGLCFLFATIWKIISPDFLNSIAFHHILLTDVRFANVVDLLGGLPKDLLAENRSTLSSLVAPMSNLESVVLQDSQTVGILAKLFTYWGGAIEALVAIAFLFTKGQWLSKIRDLFLLTFIVTTYAIAPVMGFGWTLIIMGISQAEPTFKNIRLYYVLAFVLLQIYLFPWRDIVENSLGFLS